MTTLALNTDFALRTGPFDHTSKVPKDDAEGTISSHTMPRISSAHSPANSSSMGTKALHRRPRLLPRTPHLRLRRPHAFPLLALDLDQGPRTAHWPPAPGLACRLLARRAVGRERRLGRRGEGVGRTHGQVRGDAQGACGPGVSPDVER